MCDVLVHDPQSLAIHRDDEACVDLSERLQVANLIRMRKRGRRVTVRPSEVAYPLGTWSHSVGWSSITKGRAWLKRETLLEGWRHGRQDKTAVSASADAIFAANSSTDSTVLHRRNDGTRNTRLAGSWRHRVQRTRWRIPRGRRGISLWAGGGACGHGKTGDG